MDGAMNRESTIDPHPLTKGLVRRGFDVACVVSLNKLLDKLVIGDAM